MSKPTMPHTCTNTVTTIDNGPGQACQACMLTPLVVRLPEYHVGYAAAVRDVVARLRKGHWWGAADIIEREFGSERKGGA